MTPRYLSLLSAAFLCVSAIAQSGTLDPSFGIAGIATLQPGSLHDVANDVIALDDNTSLICGVALVGGRNSIFIAHLLEDGSLDQAFGTDNGYTFFSIGEEAYGFAMARDSQGSIYVTGIAYPTFAQAVVPLVRTDAAGQPDASFGNNGVMTYAISDSDAEARGIAVISGDRVVLAGSLIDPGFDRDAFIMRVMADGTPDTSFGDNGLAVNNNHEGEDLLTCLTILDNGNAVGAGYANVNFEMKAMLYMVDDLGVPENAFGLNGMVMPPVGTGDHAAWGITADETLIYITGWTESATGINLLLSAIRSDGELHPPFSGDGIVSLSVNPVNYGYDIKRYGNGDLVVCGTTGEGGFAAPRDFIVARYTGLGDPVMSFGTNGATVTSIDVDFDDANALAIQPDGKLLLAGFTAGFTAGTDNDIALVRFDVDWTLGAIQPSAFSISLSPNPSFGDRITVMHSSIGAAQAVLLDAAGREARVYPSLQPKGQVDLSVAGLAEGRYTLRLQSEGQVQHHALVVTR